jgi:hypothetical protein
MDPEQQLFLSLSAYLTGYRRVDLQGTGMVGEYFARVTTAIDHGCLKRLWSLTAELDGSGATGADEADSIVQREIMEDDDLGPIARNIIKLWYRGDWPGGAANPGASYSSAQAYREGLMWRTMGSHPPGAKQPGFGSWSKLPLE